MKTKFMCSESLHLHSNSYPVDHTVCKSCCGGGSVGRTDERKIRIMASHLQRDICNMIYMPQSSQNATTPSFEIALPEYLSVAACEEYNMGLESTLVEQSLDSLPQVVSEVAFKHQGQLDELHKQQMLLTQAKELLSKGHEETTKCQKMVADVNRQIWLSEQEAAKNKEISHKLESEIDAIISDNNELNSELVELGNSDDGALYAAYRAKMRRHEEDWKEAECELAVSRELRKQVPLIDALREERDSYKDKTTISREVTELTSTLREEERNLQTEIDDIQQQIVSERDKHTQIKQMTDVLHKRNTAQLTRLRGQLKEMQSRGDYWSQQATHLQNSVDKFKQKDV